MSLAKWRCTIVYIVKIRSKKQTLGLMLSVNKVVG